MTYDVENSGPELGQEHKYIPGLTGLLDPNNIFGKQNKLK
jgi:hypothetical protein